jgi:hypothetical protein
LVGRALAPDDEIDADSYIGREFFIDVEIAQNGATRVARVVPANT